MLKNFKEGSNITLLNTLRFNKADDNGKFAEYITLIYKDRDTGLKYQETIKDPDYEYYVVDPDRRVDYNRLFIEKENAHKIVVKHKDLEKDIAKRINASDFYYENIKNGNRRENQKLHLHPDIFMSDMNIEDHYKFRFSNLYNNTPCTITKSFFDIEEDTIDIDGFPQPGQCPINAISLILQEQKAIYVFLLRNLNNPQIEEFEKTVNDGSIFQELNQFVINAVGGPAAARKYSINFSFNFMFYDQEEEINLIADLFNAINNFKPDYVLAWNMAFDMVHIIERIRKLGYAPEDIICHEDFKEKVAEYRVDERNLNNNAERGDYALISSYSTFMCQMIQFDSRRKGQSKFAQSNLDYIGENVAKVKKLDYKHITTDISLLPYKSYKTFVFYNIMDTIVQYCIEVVTNDIGYIVQKSILNNTRISKGHRQTVYLTNRAAKEFYNDGFIIGNNVNKFNQKPEEKYPGAFVADPEKLNSYSKLEIHGRVVDIFQYLVDFDYSSLYPSIIRQFNIAANTQIGRIMIRDMIHNKENLRNWDKWTREISFAEDIQCQVWIEFCCRWLHLADYTTIYHEIEEFFTKVMRATYGLRDYDRYGNYLPFINIPKNASFQPLVPLKDERPYYEEGNFVTEETVNTIWEGWRANAIAHPNQQY